MATKRAEYMSVESAENFILQHEDSARKLFNRYVRDVKGRKSTFERHGQFQAEGYKRLSKALEYSSKGFSPESLSYLAYTLASKQTAYSDYLRIQKETFDTLNEMFSVRTIDKKGRTKVSKKFLKNYKELEEFTEIMEMLREEHIDTLYSSYQLINELQNVLISTGQHKTWKSMKEELIGMGSQERAEYISNLMNE